MTADKQAPYVRVDEEDGIVTLTLIQPETLNRLSNEEHFLELAEKIRQAGANPKAKAIIVTGAGRAFCAGGDLIKMAAREGFSAGTARDIEQRYRKVVHQVPEALYAIDVPTIAAVNGPAFGAGADLSFYCDIRLAAKSAKFGVTFAQLGIVSGDGGSWMLPKLVGMSKAMELTFTAEPINAEEALRIGLVSDVVEDADLISAARRVAAKIARHPTDAVRMSKRLLRDSTEVGMQSHLDTVAAFQAIAHLSPDHLVAVEKALVGLKKAQAAK